LFFYADHREIRWLRRVFFAFVGAGLLFGSSLKFRLDSAVVLALWLGLRAPWRRPGTLRIAVLLGIVIAAAGSWFYANNPRLQGLFGRGVYADASVAARYFRIHASLIGYRKDPLAALTGHGISNLWYPFEAGYDDARASYSNPSVAELDQLDRRRPSSLLVMPIRVISELGLLVFVLILIALYDRRHPFLYAVLLYVYLGFDSYAFYAVWIYLFFTKVWSPGSSGPNQPK